MTMLGGYRKMRAASSRFVMIFSCFAPSRDLLGRKSEICALLSELETLLIKDGPFIIDDAMLIIEDGAFIIDNRGSMIEDGIVLFNVQSSMIEDGTIIIEEQASIFKWQRFIFAEKRNGCQDGRSPSNGQNHDG